MMMAYKQLTKQVLGNRLFLVLLVLLTALTTLSFFFVRFTIDGNIGRIEEITGAGGDESRYRMAIASNTILAYAFFTAMTALTAFVFFLFFYRFFRSGRKQLGCLKALGFKDRQLRWYFVVFSAILAVAGGLLGLCAGYPLSDVLLQANMDTYGVSGLVRSLSAGSFLFGIGVSTMVLLLVAYLSYFFIKGKEPGVLIAGKQSDADISRFLKLADAAADRIPAKNKLGIRLALRKPLAVLLVLTAVMSFSVCMIIAYSLNISSGKVYDSQTKGHNYEYETLYDWYLEIETASEMGMMPMKDMAVPEGSLTMLRMQGNVEYEGGTVEQIIVGLNDLNHLYELQDSSGRLLEVPVSGTVIIGPVLQEVYGIKIGDDLWIMVEDKTLKAEVSAIAVNAQSAVLYVNGSDLRELFGVPVGGYNYLLSDSVPETDGGVTVAKSQRMDFLERDAVSNRISGVINQVIAVVIGCILFFLALYINFQDNTRDMLILHLMGYRVKAIRRLLIDIYRPLVWLAFVITLMPGIWLAHSIQNSLSVTTGDYMPFGTNVRVILFIAVVLTLIYQLVQWVFGAAVRRVIRREEISEYTEAE